MVTNTVGRVSKRVNTFAVKKGENFVMAREEQSTEKKKMPGVYSFRPKELSILAEGAALADAYGISLNQLLTFCLESAIEEWQVPYMKPRPRPGEKSDSPANEGVYDKPLTEG